MSEPIPCQESEEDVDFSPAGERLKEDGTGSNAILLSSSAEELSNLPAEGQMRPRVRPGRDINEKKILGMGLKRPREIRQIPIAAQN